MVYNCIVKLRNEKWVTYHSVNHLQKFTDFLDKKFEDNWLFFNVYDKNDKTKSNQILKSFQNGENRNVPTSKNH